MLEQSYQHLKYSGCEVSLLNWKVHISYYEDEESLYIHFEPTRNKQKEIIKKNKNKNKSDFLLRYFGSLAKFYLFSFLAITENDKIAIKNLED